MHSLFLDIFPCSLQCCDPGAHGQQLPPPPQPALLARLMVKPRAACAGTSLGPVDRFGLLAHCQPTLLAVDLSFHLCTGAEHGGMEHSEVCLPTHKVWKETSQGAVVTTVAFPCAFLVEINVICEMLAPSVVCKKNV